MEKGEHIHIIAVGKNIHNTIPIAADEFNMSKIIVVMEHSLERTSGKKEIDEEREKIRQSIEQVKLMAKYAKKKFEKKIIQSDIITLDNVRDAVMEVVLENPKDSKYYFNISGGTKILSNGLFLMSIWLNGQAYHVDGTERLQKLNVPKIRVEDINRNPNYIKIIKILEKADSHMLPRKIILEKVNSTCGDREECHQKKMDISSSRLTKWLKVLELWGIVDLKNVENNKRYKLVKLTDYGLFTVRFIDATCMN